MIPDDEDVIDDAGGNEDAVEEGDDDENLDTLVPLTDAATAYTFSECEIHGVYLGDSCPRCAV